MIENSVKIYRKADKNAFDIEAAHVYEEYLDVNGNILWDKIDLM